MTDRLRRFLPALAIGLVLTLGVADAADAARRGGGFGSRGARTYQVPRATETAPRAAAPVERTMTPRTTAQQQAAAQRPAAGAAQPRRPGFLGGLGGGLLGGLMLGGLLGMMMGNGFGGAAGMMAMLFQVGIIALIAMLAFSFLRRRRQQQQGYAAAGAAPGGVMHREAFDPGPVDPQPLRAGAGLAGPMARTGGHDEIGVTDKDFDAFERLLGEVQTAFGREDYAALRELATPEAMSFLAETLAVNAGEGRRNEITDVKLLQGDLSEAWREGDTDYATVAMRFTNIDIVRDRATGAVIEGEPDRPVEATEVWTFRRDGGPWGGGWKLSAVQEI